MASRDIQLLAQPVREACVEWQWEMQKAGLSYIITCTARSVLEQMCLYVQGRLTVGQVNLFRSVAGLPIFKSDNENTVVTWTLDSYHITNMFDKDLNNDWAWAFDIAITKIGVPQWVMKTDVNNNQIPDYQEAGELWKKISGGIWGGDWEKPDYPHMQWKTRSFS